MRRYRWRLRSDSGCSGSDKEEPRTNEYRKGYEKAAQDALDVLRRNWQRMTTATISEEMIRWFEDQMQKRCNLFRKPAPVLSCTCRHCGEPAEYHDPQHGGWVCAKHAGTIQGCGGKE